MYPYLCALLEDKKGGAVFTCFGLAHIVYILLFTALAALLYLCFRGKEEKAKKGVTDLLINLGFGIYILDFFLMPLAYGEIDIEKLPFHACTATCVLCFLSTHNRFLQTYSLHFSLLAFISNLVYLLYPAGVMWHAVHPLSYRVTQTLLFHGCMAVYGALMLLFHMRERRLKGCHRDLAVTVGITLWAMLGNALYNGEGTGYSHFFNWFFVVRDPFYLLPAHIAPYWMPFINIAVFFAAELLMTLLCTTLSRSSQEHEQKKKDS